MSSGAGCSGSSQGTVIDALRSWFDAGIKSRAVALTCNKDSLGRRLLSLVQPSRCAVITIQKWKEEGNTPRKYQLNRIVRKLRKLKRYKHALEVCEWMTQQYDIRLLPGDYAVHLDLIAKVRGLTSAEKFFEDLPDKFRRRRQTCTALLHGYVEHKLAAKAEDLVEKMREFGFLVSPLPLNHMLSLYIKNRQLDRVVGVIQELRRRTSPDSVTYNLWLTACGLQDDVEAVEKVFMDARNAKMEDWVTYSILANLYIKKKLFLKARSALKEMEKSASCKNRACFSSLLSLYANLGDAHGLHGIWNAMKSRFPKLSSAEYSCMVFSLIKLAQLSAADTIYAEWRSISKSKDRRISNMLLAAYLNENNMEGAQKVYRDMRKLGMRPPYAILKLLTRAHLKPKNVEKIV